MPKRVLITGGTGLVGKKLLELCPEEFDIYTTHLRDETDSLASHPTRRLDITLVSQVDAVFEEIRPDIVIHAAGAGSVDFAENNREEAWKINVGGTQHMVDACLRHAAKFIYLSSNAIFDGDNPPYDENSARNPINYYGRLKVEAEDVVTQSGVENAIVRPILMYGWNYPQGRKNPVTIWIEALGKGQGIKVVNDRFWQPLLVDDCADVIWRILETGKNGTYHVASPNRLSLYDFAQQVAQVFHLDASLIEPVPSSFFPAIAPRPVDTSFCISKIQQDLNVYPKETHAGLIQMKQTAFHPDGVSKPQA